MDRHVRHLLRERIVLTEPLFETRGLGYVYNNRQTTPSLEDVDITIGEGVKTVILGSNGAGKSTLFYHFNGIFKPKAGTVLFRGRELDYSREALTELRSRISVVVQNPDEQIFSSTVEEDVAFGPLNCGLSHEEASERISDALFKVGMEEYRARPTTQLSYGQRKRVALAGALAIRPEVLILDEPTAGLDPQMSHEVLELVDQLCQDGTTVIISTHDVDLAYSWAEEIHVLRHGHLAYSGVPETFFSDPVEVSLSGLVMPHAFSINAAVSGIRGESPEPYPRTNSQLLCKTMPKDMVPAPITIVPVDGEIPAAGEGTRTGIYGNAARRAARESGMVPDYHFNAPEYCIMESLAGHPSTLFCDSSLVTAVVSKIGDLRRFGKNIEVRTWQR